MLVMSSATRMARAIGSHQAMRTSPQSLACADRQTEVRAGKGAKCAFDEPGCSIRARRGGRSGRPSEVADRLGAKVVARPFGFVGSLEFGGSCRTWDSPAGRDLTIPAWRRVRSYARSSAPRFPGAGPGTENETPHAVILDAG